MKNAFRMTLAVVFAVSFVLTPVSKGGEEAAAFPSKKITLLVPWSAGGGTDTVMRLLLDPLSKELGVPVIIVNRPGGGGAVGLQEVAMMEPDGYTLCASTNSLIIQKYSLAAGLIDFNNYSPIARVAYANPILVVNSSSPYDTMEKFLAAAKENPLLFATSGTGSVTHLWSVKSALDAGFPLTDIPFEGGQAQLTAIMGDHADAAIGDASTYPPLMPSGMLKPLAHGVNTSHPGTPGVRPFKDFGIDLWEIWFGVWAPKGLSAPIAKKISDAIAVAMKDKKFQEGLDKLFLVNSHLGPEEFGKLWIKDDATVSELFKVISGNR